AFAEHYSYSCDSVSYYAFLDQPGLWGLHRASFADLLDATPVTRGNPPVSSARNGGITFQVAPSRAACDPFVAQTPHRAAMLAALGDGSVRILEGSMSPATYWGVPSRRTPAKSSARTGSEVPVRAFTTTPMIFKVGRAVRICRATLLVESLGPAIRYRPRIDY